MTPPLRSISDTELLVLKTLWKLGSGTVRDVHEALPARGRGWAYSTVQTFLLRLQQKGYVASEKSLRAHVFRAAVSREALVSEQLDDITERVYDGGAVPLVLSLVQGRRFSREEIEQLRQLVDDLQAAPAVSPKKRPARGNP
jgi:predicted transcriptional regulator